MLRYLSPPEAGRDVLQGIVPHQAASQIPIGNAKSIPRRKQNVKKESEKKAIKCITIGITYRNDNGKGMMKEITAVIEYNK